MSTHQTKGAFGNGQKKPIQFKKGRTVSDSAVVNMAAAALRMGGEVHRVPDGEGGMFQFILMPHAHGSLSSINNQGSN
jgi:hypothetical protein